VKATDAAQEMRKAVQVAGFLQVSSTHNWRKSQDFRVGFTDSSDEGRQSFYDFVEECSSSEDTAGPTSRLKKGMGNRFKPIFAIVVHTYLYASGAGAQASDLEMDSRSSGCGIYISSPLAKAGLRPAMTRRRHWQVSDHC
jgi:hypothetical protein